MAHMQRERLEERRECERADEFETSERSSFTGGMGDAEGVGRPGREDNEYRRRRKLPSGHSSPWSDFDVIPCLDGKARRIESGTFPLAHGISGRVGLLRGYGNAIVPQVAAEFIKACI
jgi:DNA (cytosine-5)-methyltransferase 1